MAPRNGRFSDIFILSWQAGRITPSTEPEKIAYCVHMLPIQLGITPGYAGFAYIAYAAVLAFPATGAVTACDQSIVFGHSGRNDVTVVQRICTAISGSAAAEEKATVAQFNAITALATRQTPRGNLKMSRVCILHAVTRCAVLRPLGQRLF